MEGCTPINCCSSWITASPFRVFDLYRIVLCGWSTVLQVWRWLIRCSLIMYATRLPFSSGFKAFLLTHFWGLRAQGKGWHTCVSVGRSLLPTLELFLTLALPYCHSPVATCKMQLDWCPFPYRCPLPYGPFMFLNCFYNLESLWNLTFYIASFNVNSTC